VKAKCDLENLGEIRELLIEEKQRIEQLLHRVEAELTFRQTHRAMPGNVSVEKGLQEARLSPLDKIKNVMATTKALRLSNGNLSAQRVAQLYGISLSRLAAWLGRTKQALSKTPAADSLQKTLGYFERVARLRLVTASDAEFRKWLRMSNDTLENQTPLELIEKGLWQDLADKVDDMLTGMPT
jgi:hypothetical protein